VSGATPENLPIIKTFRMRPTCRESGTCFAAKSGVVKRRGTEKMNGRRQGGRDMTGKFASLLTLMLAVAFVAGLATQVAATDCDKAQAAEEQAAEKKVEIKATVEEEKGKATVEMKEHAAEDVESEAEAATEMPE
jgi:hypothetical protein